MSNCVLGFPIYSDPSVSYTPVLSAGSWLAALPLPNLQDRRLAKVARSTDAASGSTEFNIDLGVARDVRVLALVGHNLTAAATVRWKGGTTLGGAEVYDPGAVAMSFSAVSAEDRVGINFPHVHLPPSTQNARYWRCVITDTANPNGYVQIGRLVIAGGYQPTVNMSYGAKLGLETDTKRDVTDGGAAIYQEKPVRRSVSFVLENMAQAEAFANAWKIQRLLGASGQLMFVFDAADTTLLHERSFLGVLRELTALDYPYASYNAMPFAIVEEL